MMEQHERLSVDSQELVHDDETSSSGRDEFDDLEKALLSPSARKMPPSKGKIWTRLLLWVTVVNVALFITSCILLMRASSKPTPSDQDHWKATSFYSPILERFDIPKTTLVVNGTLYDTNPPSILRQRTGKQADDEWHRIGDHVWPIIITAADVRRLGKDPNLAVKIPEELGHGPDAYIAQTEVFHHLHCLDMLRREVSYEHYYEPQEGARPGGMRHQAHIGHCFDVLAQALKCTGSVDVITFNWVEGWEQPFPDFGNRKVCRDFEALLAWVNEHAMEPAAFREMKTPPEGWTVLPEPGPAQ